MSWVICELPTTPTGVEPLWLKGERRSAPGEELLSNKDKADASGPNSIIGRDSTGSCLKREFCY